MFGCMRIGCLKDSKLRTTRGGQCEIGDVTQCELPGCLDKKSCMTWNSRGDLRGEP